MLITNNKKRKLVVPEYRRNMENKIDVHTMNQNVLLGASDLWKIAAESGETKCASSIGMKHGDFDGSFLQAKQLEFVRKQHVEKLSGVKIDRLGSMSIGVYDMRRNKVIVTKIKGRVMSHYGYHEEGEYILHPEEALFLIDVGTLRVLHHGVPLSIEEAFRYLLGDGDITLSHYLVYSYLNRYGFIVRRTSDAPEEKEVIKAKEKRSKKRKEHLERKEEKKLKAQKFTDHDSSVGKQCSEDNPCIVVPVDCSQRFGDCELASATSRPALQLADKLPVKESSDNLTPQCSQSVCDKMDTEVARTSIAVVCQEENVLSQDKLCESHSEDIRDVIPTQPTDEDDPATLFTGELKRRKLELKTTESTHIPTEDVKYSIQETSDNDGHIDSMRDTVRQNWLSLHISWRFAATCQTLIDHKYWADHMQTAEHTCLFPWDLPENVKSSPSPKNTAFNYEKDIILENIKENREDQDGDEMMTDGYIPKALDCHGYFSTHSMMDGHSSTAQNWPEYELERRELLKKLNESYALEDNDSLVKLGDMNSMSKVLSSLQLSGRRTMTSLGESRPQIQERLMYDVYKPHPNFRKTDPGRPHHRILVIQPEDELPSLADVCSISSSIGGTIPIYWAICDSGDISFYTQSQENIKPDLYQQSKGKKGPEHLFGEPNKFSQLSPPAL